MRTLCSLLLGTLVAAPAAAQQSHAAPCSTAEYRQFDFWVGDWEVVDSAGKVLGHNRITSELNGCVVHEHWTGAGGASGESFNIFRRDTRTWHQSWVDSGGNLLLLEGTLDGDVMVLRGETPAPAGGRRQHRISYRPLEGGQVRQLWEVSGDGGATWTVSFDGTYRRQGQG